MYAGRVVMELAREFRHILRAETPTHAALRDRLVGMVLVTLVVDLICSILALWFERHTPNTDIQSYGSALFWTTTQLLTVSSQIHNPVSAAGRILDVAMEAYAISVVATLAGSVGAFIVRRAHDQEMAAEQRASRSDARHKQS